MKSFNMLYRNAHQMNQYIKKHKIDEYEDILIQVFAGVTEKPFVSGLINQLKYQLPQAHIIGTTTAGEIVNYRILSQQTVISFSVFKHTKIKTALITDAEDDFTLGQNLAKKLLTDNTKVMIIFGTLLTVNGSDMLAGVESIGNHFIVAGGESANNGFYKDVFVFSQEKMTASGAVGVSLNSDVLNVFNEHSLCWRGIGKVMTVTRSHKNRVYEIDGLKTRDLFETYLGPEVADYLPTSATEFPLLLHQNGSEIARCPAALHDDGSVSFIGNVEEGAKVTFSYGVIDRILQRSAEAFGTLSLHNLESIFVYSCAARHAFIQDRIIDELRYLRNAPVCGFFAYGEYYQTKHKKNVLMNITTTVLALSENVKRTFDTTAGERKQNQHELTSSFSKDNFMTGKKTTVISVLNNLVDAVLKDLEVTNDVLVQNNEKLKRYTQAIKENQEAMIEKEKAASLGHLAAGIAHNLKTPLLTSSGGLSLLTKLIDKLEVTDTNQEIIKEMKDWTTEIKESLEYISEILGTVNGYVVNPEAFRSEFSIDELVKKINILMLHELKKAKCKLIIENQVNHQVRLFGNINDLVQVLNVLINNSIDSYKGKGGEIKIKIKQIKNIVKIDVRDYGAGINKDIAGKLFKEMVTSKGKNGTGLGLYTSYSIVRGRFCGSMSFQTQENIGTTFQIRLPIENNTIRME